MTTTTKVSITDLSIAAIEDIERQTGARMTDWPEGVESVADLYARIYSAGTGEALARVKERTFNELMGLVLIAEEDEEEDPT